MQVYKKVPVIQNILDYKECDICKYRVYDKYDWEKEDHDIAETELTLKTGTRDYDCGGRAVSYNLDICPKCFKDKLIPLIEKEYKVKFKKEEIEW